MRVMNHIKQLIVSVLICCTISSCGFSRLDEKVELGNLESIELKGLTSLELKFWITNDSRYKLEMNSGELDIFMEGKPIMQLRQIGESVAESKCESVVATRWRISGVDPITMLSYSRRLISKDLTGMSANYSAKLTANGVGRTISGEGVDLTKFMTIFAKQK